MSKKQDDVRIGQFGTVSFTKTTRVNNFIDHLENGKVMYTHCKTCHADVFQPRADSGGFLSRDMEWHEVAGADKLVSYRQWQYAAVGFDGDLPYSASMLDFGDYQVFRRLDSNLDIGDIKVGMVMTTAVYELPNGQLNFIFHKA